MLLKQHMDWARHWNMLVSTLTSLHQCSQVGWAMHWIMHIDASMDQCHNASMFTLATRCEGQGPPHFDSQPAPRAPLHLDVHLGRQGMVGIQAKNYLWGEIVSFGNARSRWSCYNLLKHFLSCPPSLEAPFSRIWANHKKLFPFLVIFVVYSFLFSCFAFFPPPEAGFGQRGYGNAIYSEGCSLCSLSWKICFFFITCLRKIFQSL